MSKYDVGDKLVHSRAGEGVITKISTRKVVPPKPDRTKLDGEKWRLKARLAEIEAQLADLDPQPYDEDVYEATFTDEGGRVRKWEGNEYAVDCLRPKS